jgi:hypothetical protein
MVLTSTPLPIPNEVIAGMMISGSRAGVTAGAPRAPTGGLYPLSEPDIGRRGAGLEVAA